MSAVLERIVASKRAEIESLRERPARETTRHSLDVVSALRRHGFMQIIGEIKFKSPSAGDLSRAKDAGARALEYAQTGAAMVSVLCDGPFFGGSYDDVALARVALDGAGLKTPVLAKEFVLDDVQLARAREAGADAALIIVRILPKTVLGELVQACLERSLEPFVEVTSEAELELAVSVGARVIGVNARDLDTLAMDPGAAERVLEKVPPNLVAVHLSGLRTPDDIARIAHRRVDAALVGEALMRLDDPRDLLGRMLAATRK